MNITCDSFLCQSTQEDSFPDISHPDWANAHSSDDVGTRIGPYQLIEVLGEGGFGTVYLAEQDRLVKRQVALKVINCQYILNTWLPGVARKGNGHEHP